MTLTITSDEQYKEVLSFPGTRELFLFKSKMDKVSLSIKLESLQLRPITCVFDSCAGPILVRADILEPR